jgi:hypothetical protein
VTARPLDAARDALIAVQGHLIAMLAAQNAALAVRVAELELKVTVTQVVVLAVPHRGGEGVPFLLQLAVTGGVPARKPSPPRSPPSPPEPGRTPGPATWTLTDMDKAVTYLENNQAHMRTTRNCNCKTGSAYPPITACLG